MASKKQNSKKLPAGTPEASEYLESCDEEFSNLEDVGKFKISKTVISFMEVFTEKYHIRKGKRTFQTRLTARGDENKYSSPVVPPDVIKMVTR